jgi:hypothetical protein
MADTRCPRKSENPAGKKEGPEGPWGIVAVYGARRRQILLQLRGTRVGFTSVRLRGP